ncbi:MAG: hypothetical protein GAK31_01918 [Stenotrophomonas maltophilia]|uniref:MASE1 domain-containing protein n=1 Tax=Stenotrophomonas maltophilia TaxID=40324 RepID=A0A7V8JMT0_STEMA|nr:MAG: hypothetical protein GAK31_01918 [Stenotrophomonas maltophilia]
MLRRSSWDAINEKISSGIRIHPAGLVLAAAYAAICIALRDFSLDQFFLPAGIRIAALLIVPPRLWVYVLLGEYIYFADLRVPTIDLYGLEWTLLASALPMPIAMLVVHLHQRKPASEAATGIWLLSISAAAALVVSGINLSLSRLLWPTPPQSTLLDDAEKVVFGHFAAIITLAPLALLLAQGRSNAQWSKRRPGPSLGAMAVMLILGMYLQLVPEDALATRMHLVLLAALPAIGLTFMHGWRGAAIAIPLLNLPLRMATSTTGLPASFDMGTFSTQQNMVVISAALLALGSSITYHHRRASVRGQGEATALRLARSSHQMRERDLRERATRLKHLGDGMDSSLSEMVQWLRNQGHHAVANSLQHASSVHSRLFREQASLIYPTGLEQVGLYVALQSGGVCAAWDSSRRVAPPMLAGNPCKLNLELQLAIYRALTEAVSLLLELEAGQLVVRARCGRKGPYIGIVAVIALLDRDRALAAETEAQVLDQLAGKILPYGGAMQCRGNRLRLALFEPSAGMAPAPQTLQ